MENFKSFVPTILQNKIRDLVELSKELVNRTGEIVISGEEIDTIEGNYRDGWIPHQDGGFSASAYISNDEGYHVCESHKAENDRMYFECLADFCWEYDIEFTRHVDVMNNSITINDTDFWDNEENREKFYEYEQKWNSDGNESLLMFECFVDMPTVSTGCYRQREPENTVTIRLSVNFKDAPYYREKYATDLYSTTLSILEFTEMSNEDILKSVVINKRA